MQYRATEQYNELEQAIPVFDSIHISHYIMKTYTLYAQKRERYKVSSESCLLRSADQLPS